MENERTSGICFLDGDDASSMERVTGKEEEEEQEQPLYWCYMMVNFMPDQKINTFIGESELPPLMVTRHNQRRVKGSKSTKSAAGSWILEMIIGPFPDIDKASQFGKNWRSNSRGIPSRRKRGRTLANQQRFITYDRKLNKNPDGTDQAHATTKKKRKNNA